MSSRADVALQIRRVDSDRSAVTDDRQLALCDPPADGFFAGVQQLCGLLHGEQGLKRLHGRSHTPEEF